MNIIDSDNEQFLINLHAFHKSKGTSFDHIPEINGNPINLNHILTFVRSHGGVEKVNEKGLWKVLADDFGMGFDCVNGSEAIKYMYLRYLHSYDRSLYYAVPGDNALFHEDDEDSRFRKGLSTAEINQQYYTLDSNRRTFALRKMQGTYPSRFQKLKLSLLSGFPNEFVFSLNSLQLISNDLKHFEVESSSWTKLIELLLARVGVMTDRSEFIRLFSNWWRPVTGFCFLQFWYENVNDLAILNAFLPALPKKCKYLY
ncbi:hypothetical protein GJ496_010472 [Pomphorhynchus laevis]|nr:hypothetical protein GJ496_010472 [Pomphorhynchus laevis]